MFSKVSPMDRGGRISSLAGKAAIVPVAAGALAMLGLALASGTASAAVIYQDSFSGSGALNGAAPTVDNGSSSTWTAATQWADSGYFNANTDGTGRATAQLGFTPQANNIYTLSATVSLTSGANNAAYLSIGFLSDANSGNLTDGWDQNPPPSGQPSAAPWALVTILDNSGTYFTGPGTANAAGFSIPGSGDLTNNTIALVLNTTSSTWTYQVYDNGTLESGSNPIALPNGTSITAVGMQGASAIGTVSNFELSSVPEPATLGLVAVGGLGLLLLKRRKTV
ncbi:MAG: PEP-CTERM sorting domain-containing protein [Phycisphaerae bacterium]